MSKIRTNNKITLLFFFLFTSIGTMYAQFQLRLEFIPSYLPKSVVLVNGLEEGSFVKVYSEKFADSALINATAVKEIRDFFENYMISSDTTQSVLIAHVKGSYLSGTDKRNIEFNSPKKGDKAHVLLQRLWAIMYDVLKDEQTITYLERLEQQFDFGLGIKTLSEKPLTYKLYGKITAHESEAFLAFLNSLPTDQKVIIDMVNFESMGRVFYPSIKAANERNGEIYWINCNNKARVHLLNARTHPDRVILKAK